MSAVEESRNKQLLIESLERALLKAEARIAELEVVIAVAEGVKSGMAKRIDEDRSIIEGLRERAEKAEAELAHETGVLQRRLAELAALKAQMVTVALYPETNHAKAIIASIRAAQRERP